MKRTTSNPCMCVVQFKLHVNPTSRENKKDKINTVTVSKPPSNRTGKR